MVLVEEKGGKWVIERFYRWRRNVLAAKPYHTKPYMSNLYIPISPLYHIYDGLSNLYSLKNPIKKYPNLPRKPGKNI
jgi:hypothetical protein